MLKTFKLMQSILTGKERTISEKELIKKYKKELNPNILAYFYVANYGVINIISNKYECLQNEDKASFCLQELDKCLQNFNQKQGTKFITYFSKCYKNRLRTESEALHTNSRKANLNCEDYDTLIQISSRL